MPAKPGAISVRPFGSNTRNMFLNKRNPKAPKVIAFASTPPPFTTSLFTFYIEGRTIRYVLIRAKKGTGLRRSIMIAATKDILTPSSHIEN